MTILTLAPGTSRKLHKLHRTLVDWAGFMIEKVRRWQPESEILLVGMAVFAAITLIQRCQGSKSRCASFLVCVWMPFCMTIRRLDQKESAVHIRRKASAK